MTIDKSHAGESDPDNDDPVALPPVELLDGLPSVVESPARLEVAAQALRNGTGAVAVDAERASGFRYGQRAYLVQLYRRGSGTWLIDPTGCPDLTAVQEAVASAEWVLHAASQDLPCLRELGLSPHRLFDTELAGRLLGRDRVGLGPLVESELSRHLAKGHGAADWSTRPLPPDWLRYAALDVEVLLDLRDLLDAELKATGKEEWAREEFQAVLDAPPPEPRRDPWRRTSGLHRVRGRRPLAVVRELWLARDDVAQQRDVSPGRVLPDAAIVAAALALPDSASALADLPEFAKPGARRHLRRWASAVEAALALPEDALPPTTLPGDGPPPPRLWAERDPAAAARLAAARASLAALAESVKMPVENLASPDAIRRLAWRPPADLSDSAVDTALAQLGVRRWQRELVSAGLTSALGVTPPG